MMDFWYRYNAHWANAGSSEQPSIRWAAAASRYANQFSVYGDNMASRGPRPEPTGNPQSHRDPGSGALDDPAVAGPLAALCAALAGGENAVAVWLGWFGNLPALVRSGSATIADLGGGPVDARTVFWRASGLRPVAPGDRPPSLPEAWRVRVDGDTLTGVDTHYGDQAAQFACDWGPAPGDPQPALAPDWLSAARDQQAVALVAVDLPQALGNADDTTITAALAAEAAAGRLFAGLARLDETGSV
ncbi:hypothetical protein [Actinoplanes flavus]|uniref:Uncharacterized protein n=1 Tax=Actinoplanes flavus TaxID=2820290 RepID=A0ABS3UD36_9ACTN|nr:hypothetical protein [Actinoplanes flavus]MBO3736685.1 hypothetical protein [Actinoplanes flavus]